MLPTFLASEVVFVQGLAPEKVAVVIQRAKKPLAAAVTTQLAQVGPVSVTAESKRTLQALLGGGLLLILVLSGVLVLLVVRLGRLRSGRADSPEDSGDDEDGATGTLGSGTYDRTR